MGRERLACAQLLTTVCSGAAAGLAIATATRRSLRVRSAFSRETAESISLSSILRFRKRARSCASDNSRADSSVSASVYASMGNLVRTLPVEPWNPWNHGTCGTTGTFDLLIFC